MPVAPEQFPFLSGRVLEELALTPTEVVDSIERAIRNQRRDRAWNAPKVVITPPGDRYVMATLSAADDPPVVAVKALVLNPRNRARGLPDINALVMVLDSDTGRPLAVLDGNWITAVRTAGLSAVAARRLARPDAESAAFIGCGVQAHSHLRSFAALFPLREISAFSRSAASRNALEAAATELGLMVRVSPTVREAVQDADLIVSSVTLKPRPAPFVDGRWLKPGAFATLTDLAAPWFPEGMRAFDRIVIDDLEQEARMPDPMVQPELIAGDLSGLVEGDVAARLSHGERVAFVFRGLALGDLAVAGLACQRAGLVPA
jgi:ornithine cyclodeaminase/alanine dehydrogenase